MTDCGAYTTGSGARSCRRYDHDVHYSKVYCPDEMGNWDLTHAPQNFKKQVIVRGFKDCNLKDFLGGKVGACFGDFLSKKDRVRLKSIRVYDKKNKLDCCLGKTDDETLCAPEWCRETENCDNVVRNYCKTEKGKKEEECGCLLPRKAYEDSEFLGPPECVDKRCAGAPKAYKTKSQRNRICPDIVKCTIGDISITGTGSNINFDALKQQCGPEVADELKKKIAELQGGNGGEEEPSNGGEEEPVIEESGLDKVASQLGTNSTVLVLSSVGIIAIAAAIAFFLLRKKKKK